MNIFISVCASEIFLLRFTFFFYYLNWCWILNFFSSFSQQTINYATNQCFIFYLLRRNDIIYVEPLKVILTKIIFLQNLKVIFSLLKIVYDELFNNFTVFIDQDSVHFLQILWIVWGFLWTIHQYCWVFIVHKNYWRNWF